jgi:hypothetical protein
MKLAIFAGLALALTTSVAFADQFEGMYGNTVVQKRPDGSTSRIHVNRDGTWEQFQGDKRVGRGTFTWKDDTHFCIKVVEPAPKPGEEANQECNEITGNHKVGDTWTMTDDKGGTTTLSITAGRN